MTKPGPAAIDRRTLLKAGATAGLALAAGPLFAPAVRAQSTVVRIGYVTPQTGALASYSAADDLAIRAFLGKVGDGLVIGGETYSFEVLALDSQSNANRAAEVARGLIIDDEVNLMLVGGTAETAVPVAAVCEAEGMPTVSTLAPWQAWFAGLQADGAAPDSWKGLDYVFHHYWGIEDAAAVYAAMWKAAGARKTAAVLLPEGPAGDRWADPAAGLGPVLKEKGYALLEPGRFTPGSGDFAGLVAALKDGGAEAVACLMGPQDFTAFWTAAGEAGFQPRAATLAGGLMSIADVDGLGADASNLSAELGWSPLHPFVSSMTGETSADLAAAFEKASGQRWNESVGFVHSLFEIALDVMKRTADPLDLDAITDAIEATDLATVAGTVKWGGEGVPEVARANVAKAPLVGGQWRRSEEGALDLVLVENAVADAIPTTGETEPLAF